MQRRLFALPLIAAGALLFAACSGSTPAAPSDAASGGTDLESLIAAAQAEGSLTWYTGTPPSTIDKVVAAFQEKYGIQVETTRLPSSDIAQRYQSELASENVQVDVMSTVDQGFFLDMADAGNLKELTDIEKGDLGDEFILGDVGAVVTIGVPAFGYNKDELGDFAPKAWDDVLNPKLDGGLILVDPRGSQAWAQMWSVVYDDPGLGPDYIEKVGQQGHQVVNSGAPGAELLNAGEGSMLIGNIPGVYDAAITAGAPIDYFVPQDPFYGIFTWAVVATKAPHPNASTLFLNWLTSEEGSQVYNAADLGMSPLGDLEGTWPQPEGGIVAPPTPDEVAANLPKILTLLQIQ